MNIQTEHLENHTARLTVQIDRARLDQAKQQAARKISRQVRIPGFRKGKAPYRILANYVGEAAILEDAIEVLGQEIYKEALTESQVEPYGPGALEDFKVNEDEPVFIYTVPLQPTVDLGDYRSVRLDFEIPEVTEEMVDEAMEGLRQRYAEAEPVDGPAEMGHRVTLDIHSEFADDAPEPAEGEESGEAPKKGDNFLHEHSAQVILKEEDGPILPGFSAALVGAGVGDEREFDLTIPDEEDYKDVVGRAVHFHVTVGAVESVTLPELDDEFAEKATEEEGEILTLDALRERMRESLKTETERRAESDYAEHILDVIVEGAKIAYPEVMVEDQVQRMAEEFEDRLKQQGISLDNYFTITGTNREELNTRYHDPAIRSVERMLTLREVVDAEKLDVKPEQVEDHIDELVAQFGDQAQAFRRFFDTPQMRESIVNDLLTQQVMDYISFIGKGLDPVEAAAEKAAEAKAAREEAIAQAQAAAALAAAEAEPPGGDEAGAGESVEAVAETEADAVDEGEGETPAEVSAEAEESAETVAETEAATADETGTGDE